MTKDQEATSKELEDLVEEKYIPSAIERKRSVLIYFLIWIILTISRGKVSSYELYHLKQSIWWRSLFVLSLVVSVFIVFVPVLRWLPILLYMFLLGVLIFYVKQANDWYYASNQEEMTMQVFYSIGDWVFNVFDIQLTKTDEEENNEESKDLEEETEDEKNNN